MKIMLVARVVPQHRPGGMPHCTFDRAEALAKAGHEVHVVTTALANDTSDTFVKQGSPTVYHVPSKPQVWSKEFANQCELLANAIKPDILHSDSFDRDQPWWIGKPMHITMHGFGMGSVLTQWNRFRVGNGFASPNERELRDCKTEAASLSKARTVIGVSKWEWRMLRDQYGLRQAKLIYNPIAPCFFDAPPMYDDGPTQRTYFLCAAVSQGETRGFDVAQRAAKLAGVELRIARDVPRRDIPALYDGAKALVLPTTFCQGYDLSIAEARARGCPAILSPTGSYLDEAKPWDRFVEIGDVEGLASALQHNVEYGTPVAVPVNAADEHRPERHVERWLEAVT